MRCLAGQLQGVRRTFPKLKIVPAHTAGGATRITMGRFMGGALSSRRDMERKPCHPTATAKSREEDSLRTPASITGRALELCQGDRPANCWFGHRSAVPQDHRFNPHTARRWTTRGPIIAWGLWLSDERQKKQFRADARKLMGTIMSRGRRREVSGEGGGEGLFVC